MPLYFPPFGSVQFSLGHTRSCFLLHFRFGFDTKCGVKTLQTADDQSEHWSHLTVRALMKNPPNSCLLSGCLPPLLKQRLILFVILFVYLLGTEQDKEHQHKIDAANMAQQ